jgi:mycothiol system anti-sigma-R factor
MTCEEAVNKLYEYLDRELNHATAEQLEKHLEICKLCCNHMEFEKSMKELVQKSCVQEKAPPFLKNKILDNMSQSE